jgi:hypothetical protein
MADAVTTQKLVDSAQRAVFKFTNISDGTGEAAVVKIDVSALAPFQGEPCTGVSIQKLDVVTVGMGLDMLWDATTDALALSFGSDDFVTLDFSRFGGITNNAGAGKTGDLVFTTVGAASGDRYTVVIEVLKSYG